MFKKGDRVNVRDCEELIMPCVVDGPDDWMPRLTAPDGRAIFLLRVIGTHKKRGNQVAVRVCDAQLTLVEE